MEKQDSGRCFDWILGQPASLVWVGHVFISTANSGTLKKSEEEGNLAQLLEVDTWWRWLHNVFFVILSAYSGAQLHGRFGFWMDHDIADYARLAAKVSVCLSPLGV